MKMCRSLHLYMCIKECVLFHMFAFECGMFKNSRSNNFLIPIVFCSKLKINK